MTTKINDGELPTANELAKLSVEFNKENSDKTTKQFLREILDDAKQFAKETTFRSFEWEGTNYPVGINCRFIKEQLDKLGYCDVGVSRERPIGGKIRIYFSW